MSKDAEAGGGRGPGRGHLGGSRAGCLSFSRNSSLWGWGSRSPRGRGEWFSAAETPHELDPRSWACPASGVDANRPCCGRCRVHAGHTAGDRHAGRSQRRGRRRRRSRERPGAPGAGGPAREGSGALCADSGVQPRGSAVWTGGRGAESVVVQAEPTAGADVSVSSPRWKSPARGNAAPKAAAVGQTGFAVRPSHSRRGHDGAVAGRNRWPGGPRVTLTTSRAGGSLGQHPPGTCQPHSSEGGRRVEGAWGSLHSARCPVLPAKGTRLGTRLGQRLMVADVGGAPCPVQGLGPQGAQAGSVQGLEPLQARRASVGEAREHGWAHTAALRRVSSSRQKVEPRQSHEELKCES